MKAVYFEEPGGVNVLKYGDFPNPQIRSGEALVRVRACGVNRLDIWLRKGRYQVPLPHIPGSDVTGIVEKITGKSIIRVGDEVVINPAIPCGSCHHCHSSLPCEMVKILGFANYGGYAELIVVPIPQLYVKPKNLSFIEASAFPLTFLTAWHMLVGRAKLQRGETVFIWGASGALGTGAIQIAKYLGAKIIAAAGSPAVVEKLEKIGVDKTVVYTQPHMISRVKSLTQNQGVDVVFESVGEKTWITSLAIVRPLGRVVIAGTTSGAVGKLDLGDVYYRQLAILGAMMGTKKEFETVLDLVSKGKIKPIIDTVYPLKNASKAHDRLEKSKNLGKIVLRI